MIHKITSGLAVLAGLTAAAMAQPAPTTKPETVLLWSGTAPGSESAPQKEIVDSGSDGVHLVRGIAKPDIEAFWAAKPNGTAIVVIPGGSYVCEAFDKEGREIALWLNTLGIDAFVLKYRLPDEGHANGRDVPLQDAQRAIRLIRAGLPGRGPAKKIGVMGFSAGGHLAATVSAYYDKAVYVPRDRADALSARPDFLVAVYAFIPRPSEIAAVSDERGALFAGYPFEAAVTPKTPPAFVATGEADEHVPPEHSRRIVDALRQANVPAELHTYAGAHHGFALRGTGAEQVWPSQCERWMRRMGFID